MFVQTVEKRRALKSPVWKRSAGVTAGWTTTASNVRRSGWKTGYGQYLLDLLRARPRQY